MTLSRARAVLEKMTPGPWRIKKLADGNWVCRSDRAPVFDVPVLDDHFKNHKPYVAYGLKEKTGEGIALLGSIHRQLFDVVDAANLERQLNCTLHDELLDALKALETRLAEVLNDK